MVPLWLLGLCTASRGAFSKTDADSGFALSFLFSHKNKILFGGLLVSKNRCKCRSLVKVKWYKTNFQKVGDTCRCFFYKTSAVAL